MTDIQSIIEQMSLEQKAALCTGASVWTTTDMPELKVPALVVSDGPHGVRRVPDNHSTGAPSLPATCFPAAACLASTWNKDLLREMGGALAEEAITHGVDVLLGPGLNMKRTPLCGRNFEYFSEDPLLAGELAASLIDGVQKKGIGTTPKHFAANNQEYQRFSVDVCMDERTLREIYLPAFETVIKQTQPWAVMCAYNKINGTYCSENRELLVDILKHEWGFAGLVMSDWGAVHDRVKSLASGLDLEMPGPKPRRTQAVIEAVRHGKLDEAILDEAVRRILAVALRSAESAKGGAFDADAHHALARRIAGEGIVLLKNNGVLPLRDPQRIAVIGRAAKTPHFQGGGSSYINPTQVDAPIAELENLIPSAELTYSEGYPETAELQQMLIDEAVMAARSADVALVFVALPAFVESEGYDRTDLNLTPQQVALIKAVSADQPQCVVILNNGSAVAMTEWIDGVAAVLAAGLTGQAGGGALADVLTGAVSPSGKLAETFPLKEADLPSYLNYPGANGEVRYGEGIFIGYRYYDAKEMPVLFPFGHGLSYTTFEYGNPQVSADPFKDVDGLVVSVAVANTGKVAGQEIVQLYVHDHASELVRPPKELKGFAKVALQPGETKTVTIPLDFRAFAYFHPGYEAWITESGAFDILIGASAADIRRTVTVTLESTLELPSLLDRESTLREWLDDPRGQAIVAPTYALIKDNMGATFGAGDGESAMIGMDMLGFLLDMPLLSALQFQENTLPTPAEDLVDTLLRQVHTEK